MKVNFWILIYSIIILILVFLLGYIAKGQIFPSNNENGTNFYIVYYQNIVYINHKFLRRFFFFFLLLAPHGATGIHSMPSTGSVQSCHFFVTPCETHCLNLFLDCSSSGCFGSALLSFPLRSPSKNMSETPFNLSRLIELISVPV